MLRINVRRSSVKPLFGLKSKFPPKSYKYPDISVDSSRYFISSNVHFPRFL